MEHIRTSIESAVSYLSEHPDEARYTDSVATATLGDGLRFTVTGPGGEEIATDMPAAVGGAGGAPSPGWLFRAAVASCAGSLVAMEAARAGVALAALSVDVDGESDDRGILGMDPEVPPGPLALRIVVRVAAEGAQDLTSLVRDAVKRCPVADAVGRAVETTVEVLPAG
jgi:uncharacterized OsmC-like protein